MGSSVNSGSRRHKTVPFEEKWMSDKAIPKVSWGPCCFCALEIRPTETDPCRVTVETANKKWQLWFCHGVCFKERLANPPHLMGMFEPAHF